MACVSYSVQSVQVSAASDVLKCPKERITLTPFKGDTNVARGCGREVMLTCAAPSGCFPMQDLRQRASFELGCSDKAALEIVPLDELGHTVGVTGCGKKSVYQYVQVSAGGFDWVLGSDSRPAH